MPEDQGLWEEVRTLLESFRPLGFAFEDAKEAQPLGVSEKVRAGIGRNDVYLGILTRRDRVVDGNAGLLRLLLSLLPGGRRWSPPPWVVQESGYALGVGRRVVLLIEDGVKFPDANLDADREWIRFKRDAVREIDPQLTALINNLIRERLPAVPAAGAPISAPETAAPTETEEALASKGPSSFGDITELLDKGEFAEADRAFEHYHSTVPEGRFKRWLPYFYLYRKAITGHRSSLEKLGSAVNEEQGNVEARTNLASYYEHFDQPIEAERILLENLAAASQEGQARLMRDAVQVLTKFREHERALKVVTRLVKEHGGSAESFTVLADVAGAVRNHDLEVAALERSLAIDPGQVSVRFRLAYAYSQHGNPHLAMYHYKVRLSQGPDASALNNLGVAYDAVKLPGKQIESYLAAAPNNELARANLSHAYVDSGFLSAAEETANAVLAGGAESADRERAASALQRIRMMRGEESEKEEKIMRDARGEAEFRAAYAEAYLDDAAQLVPGQFETPHGLLAVQQDGGLVAAEARIRETAPRSLLASLAPGGGTREQTRVVKLGGSVHQRAGSFTLSTEVTPDGLFATPERSEVKGLFVVGRDGQSLQVLENRQEGSRIYTARLVGVAHNASL